MAHMFPQELTEQFSGSDVSGEKCVYNKLAEGLDNHWYVFHDLRWDDPSLIDDHPIGQADFVIANPEYGFLVLEVKGGRCSYHANERVWETEDRHGVRAEIKDPFEQAKAGARVIHKLLRKSGKLRNRMKIPRAQSAALFPDCTLANKRLRADIPEWKILDQEDLFNAGRSIRHLFENAFPEPTLEKADGLLIIDEIKKLWGVHDVQGRRRLDLRLKQSFEKLVALTDSQRKVLRSLEKQKRVRVSGCAGSGKTTLAIHKAKMLADAGKQVGLFCFNIPLAEHLRRECVDYENITVGAIAELFKEWLREAGVSFQEENTDEWYAATLPNLVFDNLGRINHRFGAVVVDEGQDIKENYWPVIELMLSDQDEGVFYVFADKGQNIYQGKMNLSFEPSPYSLNQNVRNTNQVFDVMRSCCEVTDDIDPSGVDGPKPQLYRYGDDQDMLNTLHLVLERLVNEAVSPNDIAILGTRSQPRTVLQYGEKIGPFRLVEMPETGTDIVTMSMYRYKGLEAPVVILCELDDSLFKRDRLTFNLKDLLYVGMTRPTGQLIVLATGEAYEGLKKKGFKVMERD